MLKEFKAFAMRGNVLDLAVGIIIGAAFGSIVKSMVDDVIKAVSKRLGGVKVGDPFRTANARGIDIRTTMMKVSRGTSFPQSSESFMT